MTRSCIAAFCIGAILFAIADDSIALLTASLDDDQAAALDNDFVTEQSVTLQSLTFESQSDLVRDVKDEFILTAGPSAFAIQTRALNQASVALLVTMLC
jgi:hypothetical protein